MARKGNLICWLRQHAFALTEKYTPHNCARVQESDREVCGGFRHVGAYVVMHWSGSLGAAVALLTTMNGCMSRKSGLETRGSAMRACKSRSGALL